MDAWLGPFGFDFRLGRMRTPVSPLTELRGDEGGCWESHFPKKRERWRTPSCFEARFKDNPRYTLSVMLPTRGRCLCRRSGVLRFDTGVESHPAHRTRKDGAAPSSVVLTETERQFQ